MLIFRLMPGSTPIGRIYFGFLVRSRVISITYFVVGLTDWLITKKKFWTLQRENLHGLSIWPTYVTSRVAFFLTMFSTTIFRQLPFYDWGYLSFPVTCLFRVDIFGISCSLESWGYAENRQKSHHKSEVIQSILYTNLEILCEYQLYTNSPHTHTIGFAFFSFYSCCCLQFSSLDTCIEWRPPICSKYKIRYPRIHPPTTEFWERCGYHQWISHIIITISSLTLHHYFFGLCVYMYQSLTS